VRKSILLRLASFPRILPPDARPSQILPQEAVSGIIFAAADVSFDAVSPSHLPRKERKTDHCVRKLRPALGAGMLMQYFVIFIQEPLNPRTYHSKIQLSKYGRFLPLFLQ
jgi:hypothetical protein